VFFKVLRYQLNNSIYPWDFRFAELRKVMIFDRIQKELSIMQLLTSRVDGLMKMIRELWPHKYERMRKASH